MMSIVMAGEVQHSANTYSKNRNEIDTGKLFWYNVQTAIVGHPRKLPILYTILANN